MQVIVSGLGCEYLNPDNIPFELLFLHNGKDVLFLSTGALVWFRAESRNRHLRPQSKV